MQQKEVNQAWTNTHEVVLKKKRNIKGARN